MPTGGKVSDIGNKETQCSVVNDNGSSVCTNKATLQIIKKKLDKTTKDDEKFVKDLMAETKCETEKCAIKKMAEIYDDIASLIKKSVAVDFKLDRAYRQTKLLSNSDIDSILKQVHSRYEKFYHMDFHMIDFDTFNGGDTPLNKISIAEDVYGKGYESFGVVLNTDRYNNKGIHWFCLFCDLRGDGTIRDPYTIEYFNSSGNHPRASVSKWMIKQKCMFEKKHPNKTIKIIQGHPIAHQKEDVECGVYCLYYIISRTLGVHTRQFFEDPKNGRITDGEMTEFRKALFIEE